MMSDRYDELSEQLSSALEVMISILSEKLNNYGIYYRIFARTKKGDSIRRKLQLERYQQEPDRKIMDLLGLRIVLYYRDDIEVCKKVLASILEPAPRERHPEETGGLHWEEYESSEDTFTATKTNGVFELPGFVKQIVEPFIEGLRIAPTFEVQLRTMFFEGWHEVEHDLRYKDQDLWEDFPKESRKLNSVLATLEMCDQYMLTLFDDIGHDFYKQNNWGQMIRYTYRLKTLNGELDEEIENRITPTLAKRIFKWKKAEFIDVVLKRNFSRLDANIIVYLVNESLIGTEDYCPEIANRFQALYQELYGYRKNFFSNISAMRKEKAFDAVVKLDLTGTTREAVFDRTASLVYDGWLRKKLQSLFPEEMGGPIHSYRIMTEGVNSQLTYDREHMYLQAELSHMGLDEPGKLWRALITVEPVGEELQMSCENLTWKPEKAAQTIMPYSRPSIYARIAHEIGTVDRRRMRNTIIPITKENCDLFLEVLQDEERRFPVILLSYPSEEERYQKNSDYGRLVDYINNPKYSDQSNLMRKISYVSHVCCATGAEAERIAALLGEQAADYDTGVRVFGKGFTLKNQNNYQCFTKKEIETHKKDLYPLNTKPPYCYMSVSGADAVRHDLIQIVYRDVLRE